MRRDGRDARVVVGTRQTALDRALVYAAAPSCILVWSAAPFLWQFSTSFQLDKALTGADAEPPPRPRTLEHYCNIFVEKSFQL